MFDVGFSELLVIGVVALIVIGPERLPKVARTAGAWLGRMNRYASQIKHDIERDIKLEELRKAQQEMRDTAQKYEIMGAETVQEASKEIGQVEKTLAAMSLTDGGLSQQAYEELKAGESTGGQPDEAGAAGLPAHRTSLDDEIQTDDLADTPERPAQAAETSVRDSSRPA